MRLKSLMEKPVLMLGLLILFISIMDMRGRGVFSSRNEKMTATSCKSVLVMLNKRKPENWTAECESNNLAVTIYSDTEKSLKDPKQLRALLYRELANSLTFIAKNSLNESLERVHLARIKMSSKSLEINAVTEGKDIAKFATMNKPKIIAAHLQATVQVRETKN